MLRSIFFFLFAVVSVVEAGSVKVPRGYKLHERHHTGIVQGWVKRDRVPRNATLPVRISLRQGREVEERGEKLLMDISDPKSPNYGKHMTAEEVVELFAPKKEALEDVKGWLVGSGVEEKRLGVSGNKQWIQFDAPAEEVEKLLYARFHVFEHAESGAQNIACSEYHIPHHISHHVDYITPGIKLMAGGYDEPVMKRMVEKRWFEWGRKSNRKGGKKNDKNKDKGKGGGKGGSSGGGGGGSGSGSGSGSGGNGGNQPTPNTPAVPDPNEAEFKITTGCDEDITPQCIRNQYQIPNGTRAARGNELGIFQSLNQHYNQEDMDNYWKYVAPWVPKGTHPELRAINGAYGPTPDVQQAGEEANLDFQVSIPLIYPQKALLFQTDDEWYQQDQQRADTKYLGFFNTFFDALDGSYCTLSAFNQTGNCKDDSCRDPEYPNPNHDRYGYQGDLMCGSYRPPNVIAISYSGFEHAWPENYMRRQCMEIMKLSLQGITVVESSGDYGVGGRRGNPNAGCLGPAADVFSPRIMGNCPYVLSVGATVLKPHPNPKNRGKFVETATERFASGGGFSNVFMRPPWQERHVASYIKRANVSELGYNLTAAAAATPYGWEPSLLGGVLSSHRGKRFNKGGRGYPDVAAIGDNYRIVLRGYSDTMSGTSVSVPIWASILTLINEERLARGKRPVGFIHQVLYEHPEVFNDITDGSNPGCGTNGFPVKEGWDPVTGLGTPIYPKLLKLFLSLP